MSKYDKLKKQNAKAIEGIKKQSTNMYIISAESKRVADVAHYAEKTISDIDKEFEKVTGLNEKDVIFLFFATALQCVRWIVLPSLDLDFAKTPVEERWNASDGGKLEKLDQELYLTKHSGEKVKESSKYFSWEEIIRSPVPYDAMSGTESIVIEGVTGFGKNICGSNHHAATWGHDPIVGWVIGTLNIISRTITFTNWQTKYVSLNKEMIFDASGGLQSTGQTVLPQECPMPLMIFQCIESVSEDSKRLFAAVAKQGMHQASDKYTKMGLQIPFVSPERAQTLLREGWNSAEAEKIIKQIGKNLAVVGMQAGISILINQIIEALHLLFYDEGQGVAFSEYQVKTRKIISYSNTISSMSNIIWVGGNMLGGNESAIKDFDIGGLLVTMHRLVTDYKFIKDVKCEFIENKWQDIVAGEEYEFMEV